jgi:hypothetical protein
LPSDAQASGITGEVAEYEAARLLGLRLTEARQAEFDAIEERDGKERRLQIKRPLSLAWMQTGAAHRIHRRTEGDSVLLVLLDENFHATEIYEAERSAMLAAPHRAGLKSQE